jgi:hypothetical protein
VNYGEKRGRNRACGHYFLRELAAILLSLGHLLRHKEDYTSQTGVDGCHVMRKDSKFLVATGFCFTFGALVFAYTLYAALSQDPIGSELPVLGLCFAGFGSFLLQNYTADRIEYDDREIRQFKMFKVNPRTIRWDELRELKIRSVGPLLEIRGDGAVICADFHSRGIRALLEFIVPRVQGENLALVRDLLSDDPGDAPN